MVQPLWKTVWQLVAKLNTLFYVMIQQLCSLVLIQMEWKTCPHRNLHMDIYSSLNMIVKTWKQPRCFSASEWLNALWYIQIKRNQLSSHEKTQRSLKCILLTERIQSEKATCCMIPTTRHSGKVKTVETMKRSVPARSGFRERCTGRVQRIFTAVILWWQINVILHFSKEYTTPKANYGLWVIMRCQCRFISVKIVPFW